MRLGIKSTWLIFVVIFSVFPPPELWMYWVTSKSAAVIFLYNSLSEGDKIADKAMWHARLGTGQHLRSFTSIKYLSTFPKLFYSVQHAY